MIIPHMPRLLMVIFAVMFSTQSWAQLLGPGVYWTTASGPVRLTELPMPGVRTSSWGLWVSDDTRFIVDYTWEGASAHAQVTERRPAFRVNLAYLPDRALRNLQIVKLEQRSSVRKTGVRWPSDSEGEFRDPVAIAVSRGPDGELTVRPDADLAPGEYMLSLGVLVTQYDFSVR
jgi:hypothetical protein